MKTSKYILYFVLCTFVLSLVSCEPKAYSPDDIFTSEDQLAELLDKENPEGYKIYTLDEFVDAFLTPKGNLRNDSTLYRNRSNDANFPDIYLFSIDTLPKNGKGIYIRGRVTTDDYAGNFYKSMVIQQIVNGEQQNLRISVDLGSSGGMYQMGQEILIRCNGLAVGRYANQPQLCVPSYNNNLFASHSDDKVGWAPGRIQGSVFRSVTRMIGAPDRKLLKYDTLSLNQLYNMVEQSPAITVDGMTRAAKADGRLVVIKNVHFSGEYNEYGDLAECDTLHPDSSKNANVFAPTTGNVGYPQGRVLKDQNDKVILCSTSEYAKFAYYYLPGADKHGVSQCVYWEGIVTGILGWYMDNAESFPGSTKDSKGENAKSYKYNWSISPRGIPGIGVPDINMHNALDPDEQWEPKEYNPKG